MSENPQPLPSKVTFSFKKAPDYRIYPATGAWGGPTIDQRHLLMNISIDHPTLPSYTAHSVDEGGKIDLQHITDSASASDLERELLCGILLDKGTAKVLGQWLIDNAEKLMGEPK
jgi:hypothetical protein